MLALILWTIFGPRVALFEIGGELVLAAILMAGGWHRFKRTLRLLTERTFSEKRLGITVG